MSDDICGAQDPSLLPGPDGVQVHPTCGLAAGHTWHQDWRDSQLRAQWTDKGDFIAGELLAAVDRLQAERDLLAAIVADLATRDPLVDDHWCRLCGRSKGHGDSCPWSRAVEATASLEAPEGDPT